MTDNSDVSAATGARARRRAAGTRLSIGVVRWVWHRAVGLYRSGFHRKHVVFAHSGPFAPDPREAAVDVRCCRTFDDVPACFRAAVCEQSRASRLDGDRLELATGAVMWIALIDGEPAGSVFTRRGSDFRTWFVALHPLDVVLYRGYTLSRLRGRGVMPALMRAACRDMLACGGTAYCDARTYNEPSIRCIRRAGFSEVGRFPAIRREAVLRTAQGSADL